MKDVKNLPRAGVDFLVEGIIKRMKAGCALNDAERQVLMDAFKLQSQEERSLSKEQNALAEVPKQALDDLMRNVSSRLNRN